MASDGTYFVGRNELLAWINNTLDLNLTKIEQTANGAVACQLMDVLYQNHFPMHKIDFNASNEYVMINNYKVLQNFFNKKGIEKSIEVNKLIKARPLDNMEFIQWLKSFWDRETGGMDLDEEYDASDRRSGCKSGDYKKPGSVTSGSTGVAKAPSSTIKRSGSGKMPSQSRPSSKGDSAGKTTVVNGASPNRRQIRAHTPKKPSKFGDANNQAEDRIKELTEQLTELRMTTEESVREREFYYGKLREIEILCQTPTICDEPIMKAVEQILYAPNEEEARAIVQKCQMDYAGSVFTEADGVVETIEEDDENGNP